MFGVFSKTEKARMITVLLLFFCIFLGWQKLAMADHHYLESDWQYWEGRKIEITTVEYQADGNLEIKIAWKASTGAPFPSLDCFDKAFSLSFSGMHAVSLLDSEGGGSSSGEWGYSSYKYRCNNTESSLYQDCSVIIDAKYLQPGNLIISSYFNGTSGMHTVVIPENEEPSAPVVFPEKTEFLLGEKLTLFGEIAQENAAIEWFAICTDHEGNVSSRYVTAQSNPKIGIVTETFSDLPINAVDGQSKFTYRLRYRDKETGVWSAFSEPVTITVKRIGTIPMPEIEFPESIPVDGAGTDITISNPMEGVQYSIFRSGFGDGACFIDSIEEYTWHLSPYAVGITSFQIEATALGYKNVYTYYNMTITEGNGGQPEAPEVDIINYENGTSMTFQVIAPGMTEVYINPSSLKKRYLLGCGEQITIDFRSYYIASAEFRVKIDGKWSKETRLNFMLIDSSKLQKPSVHVYTDENGYVPSGEDIYILIKNTKNASKYQIYSYTSFFSSGNLMNSDIYRATIDATGGDIITFIPKNECHYYEAQSYTNRYTVEIKAIPEEGSGLVESDTTIAGFVIARETGTMEAPGVLDIPADLDISTDLNTPTDLDTPTDLNTPTDLEGHILNLPADILLIEEHAFEGTTANVVVIHNNCTTISAYAFANMPSLKEVHIPNSVVSIDEHAFDGCGMLIIYCTSDYVASFAERHGMILQRK